MLASKAHKNSPPMYQITDVSYSAHSRKHISYLEGDRSRTTAFVPCAPVARLVQPESERCFASIYDPMGVAVADLDQSTLQCSTEQILHPRPKLARPREDEHCYIHTRFSHLLRERPHESTAARGILNSPTLANVESRIASTTLSF